MDFSEYITLVKEAFAVQDLSKKKFSYGIQKGETSNQLKVPRLPNMLDGAAFF
jgi:hypothetical protein